jgi:hypothetical protein
MVGIADEPPRQLAPSVGKRRLDFVIRAGSIKIIINSIKRGLKIRKKPITSQFN